MTIFALSCFFTLLPFVYSFPFFFSFPSKNLNSSELLSNAEFPDVLSDDEPVTSDMHAYDLDTKNLTKMFAKILETLEKGICPREEQVEKINLGTNEDRKEIQIVENPEMIELFYKFIDVFVWSFQDMP